MLVGVLLPRKLEGHQSVARRGETSTISSPKSKQARLRYEEIQWMERSWEKQRESDADRGKKEDNPCWRGPNPKLKPDPITPWNGQRLDAIIPPGVCFPIHVS
jgi:hypothetical protein